MLDVEIGTTHNMQVSEYVGAILSIFSICSVFVQVIVIITVFYERKHTNKVFYTLYAVSHLEISDIEKCWVLQVGSIADILSLIDAVFLYNSLTGILQFKLFGSALSAKVWLFFYTG